MLARHGIQSGRILVLGAGVGRESVALANRGLQVVGLDISREALQVAVHAADRAGAKALFVQADFLHLPFTAAGVRYVLLSGIMYSAIPGRRQRQVWLRSLRAHLQDNGLVLLNFLIERWSATRSRRTIEAANRVLAALSGANAAYQQAIPVRSLIFSTPSGMRPRFGRSCARPESTSRVSTGFAAMRWSRLRAAILAG